MKKNPGSAFSRPRANPPGAGRSGVAGPTGPRGSIREEYERWGARPYYATRGKEYRNPHEPAIQHLLAQALAEWPLNHSHVLDLACGSGEVTLALEALGAGAVTGIDPFTHRAYQQRTGRAAEQFAFEDIATGALAGRRYSLIVCSFALHLLAPSRLPGVLTQLALIAPDLLILTPHKRPEILSTWGWLWRDERSHARVKARWYCGDRQ
jgi:SAM-dependent methyltransferase